MSGLRIHLAQISPLVGDIQANTNSLIQLALNLDTASNKQDSNNLAAKPTTELLVLPEMFLLGSTAADLLLRPDLNQRIEAALTRIQQQLPDSSLIVGYPRQHQGRLYNTLGVLHQGQWLAEYRKHQLSSQLHQNEPRYFQPGQQPGLVTINNCTVGLLINEDLYLTQLVQATAAQADVLVVASASPWYQDHHLERQNLVIHACQNLGKPIIYLNQVGGQGELVFDGASFACNAAGVITHQAAALAPATLQLHLNLNNKWDLNANPPNQITSWPDATAYLYKALVLGLRSYVEQHGFQGVVLGMSGGLDSALAAAIAVDALGADKVNGLMLPYHYTSAISLEDAQEEATLLGLKYQVISIAHVVESLVQALTPILNAPSNTNGADTSLENLQARSRGVILMAQANKQGLLLLTTGNKSELAVGYCTLYGDMAGGFNPLKDLYKTQVQQLCLWRNQQSYVIPHRVITRPPSAELAPEQQDSDSLPPYPVLDAILHGYLEQNLTAADLIQTGLDPAEVKRILHLVDFNEYKRQQAAPGIQVSTAPFGSARRHPLVSRWPLQFQLEQASD